MEEHDSTGNFKRKRKKGFFQQQSKFYKQGRYGNGVRLEQDNYEYFLRILDVMRSSRDKDDEEMSQMAESVFEESKGHEILYSSNQLSSRVLEDLLPYINLEHFKQITTAFRENLRPIFGDPCASHVLEKLVVLSLDRTVTVTDLDERESYKNFIIVIARFLLNNLEETVWDTYAVHIIQTCLLALSGRKIANNEIVVVVSQQDLPQEFTELMKEYTSRLVSWPQFSDLPNTDTTSSLVQNLLIANTGSKKQLKQIISILLEKTFTELTDTTDKISVESKGTDNPACARVLETCITVASKKLFKKIYKQCFKSKLEKLSHCKVGNYSVQKLVKHVEDKEDFNEMFTQLSKVIDKIVEVGYTGVLLALAQTCNRLKTKQGEFIKMLMKVLDCCEPQDRNLHLVLLTCQLVVFPKFTPETFKVNLHGSLLVQEMLKFNKPITIVNSLLNIPVDLLVKIACDPCGSHVTDVFLTSTYVGEKSREKLYKRLQGQYSSLAKSKHGSRSLDSIWNTCGMKYKVIIMNELKTNQSNVMSDKFGRGVAFRLKLDHFRHDKDNWIKLHSMQQQKQKLLNEITGGK